MLKIEFTSNSKLQYTVILDCTSQHFTIEQFLTSIGNTEFDSMKEIKRQQDLLQWTSKDRLPLEAKTLALKLLGLIHSIEMQVLKNTTQADLMRGTSLVKV